MRATRRRMSAPARREVIERAASEVFAERGYRAASMHEIARRAGVSAPVLYDHFQSKLSLHRALLERHFAELRAIWREQAERDEPLERRLPDAIDTWLAYVESHPYAWRMLFADTTGEPEVQAIHREVAAQSRALLVPLMAGEPGVEEIAGSSEYEALDMVWEIFRAVLQGMALWWHEHQHVPRERLVETIMNALWIGMERVSRGQTWPGGRTPAQSARPDRRKRSGARRSSGA